MYLRFDTYLLLSSDCQIVRVLPSWLGAPIYYIYIYIFFYQINVIKCLSIQTQSYKFLSENIEASPFSEEEKALFWETLYLIVVFNPGENGPERTKHMTLQITNWSPEELFVQEVMLQDDLFILVLLPGEHLGRPRLSPNSGLLGPYLHLLSLPHPQLRLSQPNIRVPQLLPKADILWWKRILAKSRRKKKLDRVGPVFNPKATER